MSASLPCREDLARVRTRASLLARLKNADSHADWKDFFDTYWGLVFRFALRRGLTEDEAVEASQETVITVARKINQFDYDPQVGRFSSWLFAITNNWVLKQRSKRRPLVPFDAAAGRRDDAATAESMENLPDPASLETDALWEEEWKRNALAVATDRARRRVNPLEFQRYDYVVTQGHTPQQAAHDLDCKLNTVYAARHRVVAVIKEELARLQKTPF